MILSNLLDFPLLSPVNIINKNFYYYTKDYEIDEEIGLGLSDKSFFRQSVDIIDNIDKEKQNCPFPLPELNPNCVLLLGTPPSNI